MEVQEIMTTILLGMGLLLLTLAGFSLFSMKAPKGSLAMSGLANAAVATFLVEAVLKYIFGDLFGIAFLGEVGGMSGSMGGVAAAILVPRALDLVGRRCAAPIEALGKCDYHGVFLVSLSWDNPRLS